MKLIILLLSLVMTFNVYAQTAATISAVTVSNASKKKKAKTKVVAPCDTKEDILKKLKEKEKSEAEKGKGLSLQGGSTGCSVTEKEKKF